MLCGHHKVFLSPRNHDPFLGIGAVDFSGSAVVHLTGGCSALYAAYMLGSRRGRFLDVITGHALSMPKPFPVHSVTLQMLGTFILWFGWFGFNPGTALLLNDNPYQSSIVSLCSINTVFASAAGCISALIFKMLLEREVRFDLLAAMNGTLTGLVSVSIRGRPAGHCTVQYCKDVYSLTHKSSFSMQITAGCATLEPWAALATGAVAGVIYVGGSKGLVAMKIDDVVHAIPVHMIGGMWGMLAVGLLTSPERLKQAYGEESAVHPGFFYSFTNGRVDGNLLACQICAILFVIGWTFATMMPFSLFLNFMGWSRTDHIQELVGLDLTQDIGGGNAADGNAADGNMDNEDKSA